MKTKQRDRLILLLILPMVFFFIFPLLVTLTNSFMAQEEIEMNYAVTPTFFEAARGVALRFINMALIPAKAVLSQYKQVLFYQPSFLILLMNSVKIAAPVVLGNVLVSFLGAFGFTVWQYKHKEKVFFLYIVVMLMPLQAVLVPNYIIADKLNLADSYLAIILPGIFSPFGTFLLRQHMKALPKEYLEAAQMDGASKLQILLHIVLPQMKSGLCAVAMLVFIEYWNLVEQAIIFIKEYYREPLSIYLSRIGEGKAGLVFAVSCIYMLPPLWVLVAGQKDLEKGIELSGIK